MRFLIVVTTGLLKEMIKRPQFCHMRNVSYKYIYIYRYTCIDYITFSKAPSSKYVTWVFALLGYITLSILSAQAHGIHMVDIGYRWGFCSSHEHILFTIKCLKEIQSKWQLSNSAQLKNALQLSHGSLAFATDLFLYTMS